MKIFLLISLLLFGCSKEVNICDIKLINEECGLVSHPGTKGSWCASECYKIEKPYWIVYKKKYDNDKEIILYRQNKTDSEEDIVKILKAKKDFCSN